MAPSLYHEKVGCEDCHGEIMFIVLLENPRNFRASFSLVDKPVNGCLGHICSPTVTSKFQFLH